MLNQAKQPRPEPERDKQRLVLNWCFTLNNPIIGTDDVKLKQWFTDNAQRAFFELEQAKTGTPHFQGYFILKTRKYLSNLKKNCHEKAHFEPMTKSELANFRYCSKELFANKTNFYVAVGNYDEPVDKQTVHSTKEDLNELVNRHTNIDDFMMENMKVYCRHRNGLIDIFKRKQQKL